MVPELGQRKKFKAWVLDEVWRVNCPHGHIFIPAKELAWTHHADAEGMSVDCPGRWHDHMDCDYCFNSTQHLVLKETVRLTREYLELFMWGPNGTGERKTNRFQTVGAERALALAVLRRT